MRFTRNIPKTLKLSIGFLKIDRLIAPSFRDPNVLWNRLIYFMQVLRLLKKLIILWASLVLLFIWVFSFLYASSYVYTAFWLNFPTYILLAFYIHYWQKSWKLYQRFAKEIALRKAQNVSLALPKDKIFLLKQSAYLLDTSAFKLLCIAYASWIIWSYFYFYPQPQKVQTLVLQANKIEANILKHQQRAALRHTKEANLCEDIQRLYLHKERETRKRQVLQGKLWQHYGKLKQIRHKIVRLQKHLAKASRNKGYLSSQKELIEEIANWVSLKAALRGEKQSFDGQSSSLRPLLLDLVRRYERVKQKAQNAIYQEQIMLKHLQEKIKKIQARILKLAVYQGQREQELSQE